MTEMMGDTHKGDVEIYNWIEGRSNSILYYDPEKYTIDDDFEPPTDISSIYSSEKYESPPTSWAHIRGDDKVTIVYNSYSQPTFFHRRFYAPFDEMMFDFPELKISSEPTTLGFPNTKGTTFLIREFQRGAPLPQILILNDMYPSNEGMI